MIDIALFPPEVDEELVPEFLNEIESSFSVYNWATYSADTQTRTLLRIKIVQSQRFLKTKVFCKRTNNIKFKDFNGCIVEPRILLVRLQTKKKRRVRIENPLFSENVVIRQSSFKSDGFKSPTVACVAGTW